LSLILTVPPREKGKPSIVSGIRMPWVLATEPGLPVDKSESLAIKSVHFNALKL
jgi:hypothetical protein